MAEALYRKYRPQVFADVVGQEPIERTLRNAIERDKVSHAYLFCGPRGTGKTTTARLLAKALLCEKGPTPDPDGTCDDCQMIAEGLHPDVYELDAASRTGVDNVREEIISRVQFAPSRGRCKIYIIDEVHMLSVAAFNALLKTLEEPPSHVVFILCTTDPQKVPETIHSRCQRFDFRRIAPESIVSRLGAICMAEDVQFEGEALDLIAQRAEGGMRNALTALEQIIAFENGKVTLAGAERLLGSIDSTDMAEIIAYIGRRDVANCFRWTADYVETGADLAQFARDMGEHVRNMYVMQLAGTDVGLDITETTRRELASELQWFGPERLARFMGVLGDLMAELKTSSNPRLSFEIALTRLVRPDSDLTLAALAERVEALESGYSAVAHVLPGDPVVVASHGEVTQAAAASEPQVQQQVQPQPRAQQQVQPQPQAQVVQQPQPQAQLQSQPQVQSQQQQQAQQPQAQPSAQPQPQQAQQHAQPNAQPQQQPQAEPRAQVQPQPQPQVASAAEPAFTPTPATASATRLAATLENPAALQRLWQAALSHVKRQKAAYGALFMNTKARYDAASGMLLIDFPAENAFAFRAVQKGDVREALQEALNASAGEAVRFDYVKASSSAGASAPAARVVEQAKEAVHHATAQSGTVAQPHAAAWSGAVAQTRAAAQSGAVVQPDATAQSRAASQSAQAVKPASAPTPEPARASASAPSFGQATGGVTNAAYDQVPYEQVPYDDYAYEQVPYDDASFGYDAPAYQPASAPASATRSTQVAEAVPTRSSQPESASVRAPQPEPAPAFAPQPEPAPVDETTPLFEERQSFSPSAYDTADIPEEKNPEDLAALLQLGFGGGVIFEELEDDQPEEQDVEMD